MLFFVFLTALFVAMVVVAAFMRLAGSLHLVDVPNQRKVHAAPIPRVGGIGIVAGTVAALLAWYRGAADLYPWLWGVAVIALFGLWDDRRELDYRLKFLGQFLAAVVVVALPGGVTIERLPWAEWGSPPALVTVPLTVLFLLGMTNATNLSDGLDGLAAGLSLLSLACIAYLADLADGNTVILAAVAIMGAILGFLRYNTHPARVFMGDTGSQFLGFSLGVLVLMLEGRVNTALTPGLGLLVLGLPIVDTLAVMATRVASGHSPFKPDKNHFHHKLLTLGFDHYEAVLAIYLVQAAFIAMAFWLRYESCTLVAGSYLALASLCVLFYPIARGARWRLHGAMPANMSPLTRKIKQWRSLIKGSLWLRYLLAIAIPTFLIAGSIESRQLADDLAYAAIGIVILAVIGRVLHLPFVLWIDRLMTYSCVILVIYNLETGSVLNDVEHQTEIRYFFFALAAVIAAEVGRSGNARFTVTPSDYLVMLILLTAAVLPLSGAVNYAKLAIYTAVMLYGVELLLRERWMGSLALWVGSLISMVVLVIGFH